MLTARKHLKAEAIKQLWGSNVGPGAQQTHPHLKALNPAQKWHLKTNMILTLLDQNKWRSSKRPIRNLASLDLGHGGKCSEIHLSITASQNRTWALKCICLVALFFIPVFSIHFDFILWTYCMSRSRMRAAPVVGRRRVRDEARVSYVLSEEVKSL